MTRFRRTKPSNAYWLGRSMEHLAVGGTFGSPLPPPSSGILAGPGSGPGSTNIPPGSATTPSSKTRHRLVTEPCYVNDEFNEDVPKCNSDKHLNFTHVQTD